MNIIESYQLSQVIMTANRLGIFGAIGDGQRTIPEVTKSLGISEHAFVRFANALVLTGLVKMKRRRDGTIALSLARLAREAFGDHGAIDSWTEHCRTLFRIWSFLPVSISQGTPHLRNTHDIDVASYSMSLAQSYALTKRKLHEVVDLTGRVRILDVGGGIGHYTIQVALKNRNLWGMILDRPEVVRIAKRMIRDFQLTDRIVARSFDILSGKWPHGFDVVLLSNVLHSKRDAECKEILRKAFLALPPGGRLLLNERILQREISTTLFDLTLMLCTQGGRLRSRQELTTMVRDAGFFQPRWHRLEGSQWTMESSRA